jgi:hypothetical protein
VHAAKLKNTRASVAGEVSIWTNESLRLGEDPPLPFTLEAAYSST